MKIRFKGNVTCSGADPILWAGIARFAEVRSQLTDLEMVLTSLEDGAHRGTSGYDSRTTPPSNSRHYLGLAADIRSKDLDSRDKDLLLREGRLALEDLGDYLLILEGHGTENEHFHLQVGGWN